MDLEEYLPGLNDHVPGFLAVRGVSCSDSDHNIHFLDYLIVAEHLH